MSKTRSLETAEIIASSAFRKFCIENGISGAALAGLTRGATRREVSWIFELGRPVARCGEQGVVNFRVIVHDNAEVASVEYVKTL